MNEVFQPSDDFMFFGKPLSWIRDSSTALVQTKLDARYRDVVILDALNQRVATFNVTTFNLSVAENKAALKSLLAATATPADSDSDRLPDYWEILHFGDLSRSPASLMPDGQPLHLHYQLGTPNPNQPDQNFQPKASTIRDDGADVLSVTYRRRRGTLNGLTLTAQTSLAMTSWTNPGPGWILAPTVRLYDGSATDRLTWNMSAPPGPTTPRFFRVRSRVP